MVKPNLPLNQTLKIWEQILNEIKVKISQCSKGGHLKGVKNGAEAGI